MSPRPQHEMDLDVDGPRNDYTPSKSAEQARGEIVATPLRAITSRDERTRVADDQSARRESTSSIRIDKSGSSWMTPAYRGSSPGARSTSSVTSAEKEV